MALTGYMLVWYNREYKIKDVLKKKEKKTKKKEKTKEDSYIHL